MLFSIIWNIVSTGPINPKDISLSREKVIYKGLEDSERAYNMMKWKEYWIRSLKAWILVLTMKRELSIFLCHIYLSVSAYIITEDPSTSNFLHYMIMQFYLFNYVWKKITVKLKDKKTFQPINILLNQIW